MNILLTAVFLCCAAEPVTAGQYSHFAQATLASHTDGNQHNWPCIARLGDDRMMTVWSRAPRAGGEDAIVGAFSSDSGCTWTPPQVLIAHDGIIDADPNIIVSGRRVLVLCTSTSFAQGIHASSVWCVRSDDDGKTWSDAVEVPMGHKYTCGKTHRGLCLRSGALVMGYSWDVLCESGQALQSEGEMDLRAGVMRSMDNGATWSAGGDTTATYAKISGGVVSGTDEPALAELEDGSLYMLMRTGGDHLFEARSMDEGQTWGGIQPSPLFGSNAPAALSSFRVGSTRGLFVVWDNAIDRFPLCAAMSVDGGRSWSAPRDIGFPYTGGQASYPSCAQAPDGALIAVWQQDVPEGRDVRLARFSLGWLTQPEMSAKRIVVFGDSTTAPRGPLCIYGNLVAADLNKSGAAVEVINAGVGGNTTDDARSRFDAEVLGRNPLAVTLCFGINDAAVDVWRDATTPRVPVDRYESNLRYFITALREKGIQPILMTPNPMAWTPVLKDMYGKPPYQPDAPDGFNILLKDYVERVRQVAESEKVPLVDINRIFYECAAEEGMQTLLLDGMHPNDVGHRLIANALLEVVRPIVTP